MERPVVITPAGCSSTNSGKSASTSAPNTKLLIDGQDHNIKGRVGCAISNGTVRIATGAATAVVTDAHRPQLPSVGLGTINSVALRYPTGGPGNAAAANHTDTGTATGVDTSNPLQPLNKPVEIDVTCL
jgi:lipoprotein LpqH